MSIRNRKPIDEMTQAERDEAQARNFWMLDKLERAQIILLAIQGLCLAGLGVLLLMSYWSR